MPDSAFSLENFQCNRQDRNANGGGILTFIRNELHWETLTSIQQNFRNQGLEITIDSVKIKGKTTTTAIVIGVYRPPCAKHEWFNIFNELVMELIPLGSLIVLGDLNCNLLQEYALTTKKLLNVIEFGQLNITGKAPTRITENSSTCLDIIAVDRKYQCISYNVGDLAISDHLPVESEIELSYDRSQLVPTYRRNFNKINYRLLNYDLSKISLTDIQEDDPDALLTHWSSETGKILDYHAPVRAYPLNKKKMVTFPSEIVEMINLRKRTALKVKRSPYDKDLIADLKIIQRTVKSNITKYIKIQGENSLKSTDPKEA